jgi:hypothetical protein
LVRFGNLYALSRNDCSSSLRSTCNNTISICYTSKDSDSGAKEVHVVYKSKSPFDLREFYHKVISIPAMELPTSSSATVSAGASCGLCQGELLSRAHISLGKFVLHGLISEHYFCIVSQNFLMHKWKKSGFSSSLA